jgi:hypothetical protein
LGDIRAFDRSADAEGIKGEKMKAPKGFFAPTVLFVVFTVMVGATNSPSASRHVSLSDKAVMSNNVSVSCKGGGMPMFPDGQNVIIVYFVGLATLSCPKGSASCTLDLIKHADNHRFEVWVERVSGQGNTLKKARIVYHRTKVGNDFALTLPQKTAPDASAIRIYGGATAFRRDSAESDCNDLGWVLNFEGKEVYNRDVELDEGSVPLPRFGSPI